MSKSSGLAQWTVIICFYIALEVLTIHGQSCLVGTDATELVANREHSFYLNTQDPAQCDGTITEFNFCYYSSNPVQFAASYDFTFAVFRRSSSEYISVSEAFTTGRTVANSNFGTAGTFACRTFSVNDIPVQAGDVIGVCIYDPPDNAESVRIFENDYTNRLPIDMVSQNAGEDRFLMSTGNFDCGDMSVPNPVAVSSLNRANERVLHMYADITPLPTTEPPTNPTTMGTTPPSSTDPPIATPETETTLSNEVPLTNSPTTSTGNDSITMAPLAPAENTGVVVGVMVPLLVIVIVLAVVTLVVVVFLVKRGRSRKEIAEVNVGRNTTGINNEMVRSPHSISLKSNEAYSVHSETQNSATDYYDNVLTESTAEGPLYDSVTESGEGQLSTTPTQQPNDVAYEVVPGPTHYNDPCQPIPLENNEAYSAHKSGNERSTEMPGETYSQEVNLKSNEAYGVRGEVQVAAINGTADAVCYSVIDLPGQQSGEATSGTEIRMDSNEAYGTSERDRQTEETLDYDYAIL